MTAPGPGPGTDLARFTGAQLTAMCAATRDRCRPLIDAAQRLADTAACIHIKGDQTEYWQLVAAARIARAAVTEQLDLMQAIRLELEQRGGQ